MTDTSLSDLPAPLLANAERLLLAPADLDFDKVSRVLAVDSRARRRLRRPVFPVLALRELEPRGRHRQGGQLQHRPGRRRARRAAARRRRSPIPTTSRSAALEEAATAVRAIGRQGQSAVAPLARARPDALALSDRRSDRRASATRTRSRCSSASSDRARALDPRVAQVMAALAGEYDDGARSRAATACSPPTCGRWCACRSP